MNKDLIIKVGIGVGGLAVGGGAGYLLAKKQLEALYAARVEEEVEQVREMYKRRTKTEQFATPESAVESLVKDISVRIGDTPLSELTKSAPEVEEYQEIVEDEGYTLTEPERRNIFDQPEPSPAELNTTSPYEISAQEFMEGENDQVTLMYYQADDTLVDEREQPVPDPDDTVGEQHLDLLDGKNNVVYVRNPVISTDFEILLNEGAYSVLVLGNDDEHLEPRRRRGSRTRDDD